MSLEGCRLLIPGGGELHPVRAQRTNLLQRLFNGRPLYHGMGPSVIAMTWDSNLCLSVTADTRHVADAAVITDGIAAEFAALLGSAG
ncbi:hypothetical protein H7I76_21670 [Mycolicibacterium vaccae]|nr:hypothetical protein [Mycolicibacterium vaccae]